jgi:hypothetical protein
MPEDEARIWTKDARWPARTRAAVFLALILPWLLTACQAAGPSPAPAGTQTGFQETGAGLAVFSPNPSSAYAAEIIPTPAATALPPDDSAATLPPATQPAFGSCSDNLVFMGDLTYPDRAPVLPGQILEKEWKVRNGGTCDWGPEYRFRWVGGAELSARKEFALFPAAAGSEAVIAIALTAPLARGEYISSFRAFSPLGIAFGDTLYIDVVVS